MKILITYGLILLTSLIFMPANNVSAQDSLYTTIIIPTDVSANGWGYTNDDIIDAILVKDDNNYTGTSDSAESYNKSNSIIDLYYDEFALSEDTNLNDGLLTDGLYFTLKSTTHNCKTSKCTYTIDTIHSTADSIIISSLSFDFYNINYLTDKVCSSVNSIHLVSEIIPTKLSFETLGTSLAFDDSLNILPGESEAGLHVINFSSEYCLKQQTDTINIIPVLRTELAFDTLAYCKNTLNDKERIDNYTILSLNGIQDSYDFSVEQDVLISDLEDNGCLIYDTCFIKLVEPLDLNLNIDNKCDSVLVSLPDGINIINSLSWSNGQRGEKVLIDSSQTLSVQLTDNYNCISYDTVTIEVRPFEVDMDVTTMDADCWTEGEITIDEISTSYGRNNLTYTLKNKLNNAIVTDLSNIPEGIYEVEVENEEGCINTPKEIEIRQKCLEDYPVFAPDLHGQEDGYFIPHEGSVKIYDKNGSLKRTLDTPAYWDGTNESGVRLPMGVYLMVTDTGKKVNITIVR